MPDIIEETLQKSEIQTTGPSGRSFDWGPPTTGHSEGLNEWGVYALIAVLVSMVGWFLIDTGPDMPRAASEKSTENLDELDSPGADTAETGVARLSESASAAQLVKVTAGVAVPIVAKPLFHVQLGAFGDEETARSTIDALKAKGYVASCSAPDDQYEMYRVLMGPFDRESEAESLAHKLNKLDFPCFVIESANVQNREEESQ
ncbi:MAG TPA: SPOR domain-containing protein [Candidatus Ozemobacteraceae bacterium]|nr:SPOR domain-containing protein [Candidatus Ozemobacteraceae bacterium]